VREGKGIYHAVEENIFTAAMFQKTPAEGRHLRPRTLILNDRKSQRSLEWKAKQIRAVPIDRHTVETTAGKRK